MTGNNQVANIAVIGASGYTGAELVRLLSGHPAMKLACLVADRNAGKEYRYVYPGLRHLRLPTLCASDDIDWAEIDLAFCALPHGTSHQVIGKIPNDIKVVDLSADFRLKELAAYEHWYGAGHSAPQLLVEAVYGLTEFYRQQIRDARLVACTGCNAAAGLYALLPLLEANSIDCDHIVIDLKTGVSGAGRTPRETSLHAEVSEGFQPYNVARHRHLAEFDEQLSAVAGRSVEVTFVPHLLPQNRGILATVYVRGNARRIYDSLNERYREEIFVHLLPFGHVPSTRHVRGSNFVHLGVVADRREDQVMIFSTLDNLTKGSSGQAVQNANLMLGFQESEALLAPPLFP